MHSAAASLNSGSGNREQRNFPVLIRFHSGLDLPRLLDSAAVHSKEQVGVCGETQSHNLEDAGLEISVDAAAGLSA